MQFTIFNVGHGFCAAIIADNGNLVMFDCGHSADPLFQPSIHLLSQGYRTVHRLFITNYDQDHISDIETVWNNFTVQVLHRNESISVADLRQIKEQSGPITQQMDSLLNRIAHTYSGGPPDIPPSLPRVAWDCFQVNYPSVVDTNNLSLVTVMQCGATRFLIPGDIEQLGWQFLVQNPTFLSYLPTIDVFVASHHGRENGYYAPIFDDFGCAPSCFVFSDSAVKHATQKMTQVYAQRASGVQFKGQTRYVLSTRNDGHLTWTL